MGALWRFQCLPGSQGFTGNFAAVWFVVSFLWLRFARREGRDSGRLVWTEVERRSPDLSLQEGKKEAKYYSADDYVGWNHCWVGPLTSVMPKKGSLAQPVTLRLRFSCQNTVPGSWQFMLTLMWPSSKILPGWASVVTSPECWGWWLCRLLVFLYPAALAFQLWGLQLGGQFCRWLTWACCWLWSWLSWGHHLHRELGWGFVSDFFISGEKSFHSSPG